MTASVTIDFHSIEKDAVKLNGDQAVNLSFH